MKRLPDWNARLAAVVEAARGRPFAYGRHDCALFAADAVEAMTGEDPAAAFRGRYGTAFEGCAALRKAGFADHVEAVAAQFAEIPAARARPGDLAAVRNEAGELALGVVQGAWVYVARPEGVGLVSKLDAERAFRVGD